MDIRQEIAKRVEQLPPSAQEQVLGFVASLAVARPVGEKGAALRRFAGSLDRDSAKQMSEVIERECEQVDTSQW